MRYITKPKNIIGNNIEKINKIRDKINPDVSIYLEVDKKYQTKLLDGARGVVVNKYKKKRRGSFGNAVITDMDYKIAYAPFSKKALFFEVYLSDNIHLIGFHFSLSKKTRKKQFDFFKSYMESQGKKYILCGDFNIFDGIYELKGLSMQNISQEPTFPAHKPKHALDLFLVSDGIKVVDHTIHADSISDHLCVSLEIDI